MKLEISIDSKSFRRGLVILALPAFVVSGFALVRAAPVETTPFEKGETLTANKLNSNFDTLRDAINANRIPPGTIAPYAGEIDDNPHEGADKNARLPPAGWVWCNGAQLNGLEAAYADLYTVVGTTFGGNASSKAFNLPDLRGMFLRGVDSGAGVDPDAASRMPAKSGKPETLVGTLQASAVGPHTHKATDKGHTHKIGNQTFEIPPNGGSGAYVFGTNGIDNSPPTGTGYANIIVEQSAGTESRPVNFAVHYLIKL